MAIYAPDGPPRELCSNLVYGEVEEGGVPC